MSDKLEKIQALPEEHRERIMGEYIKMKLRQRKRQGWKEVNNEIRKKMYFSKLKVQSLRQYIPFRQIDQECIDGHGRYTRINKSTSNRTSRTDPERIYKNKTLAA